MLRFAVIQRPESAVGAPVTGREPAMKIEHPEPSPRQQATADQRGSEDGDDIGVQSIGERDHVRMVDVRYLDEKILAGQRGRRRIEEKLRFAPARIAAP